MMSQDPNYSAPEPGQSSVFDTDTEVRERMHAAYKKGVKQVRLALFAVGVLTVGFDLLVVTARTASDGPSTRLLFAVGLDVCLLGLFIALGFWAMKKPFSAVVAGIILFFALQIIASLILGKLTTSWMSLLIFFIFVSVIQKAKSLQRFPYPKEGYRFGGCDEETH